MKLAYRVWDTQTKRFREDVTVEPNGRVLHYFTNSGKVQDPEEVTNQVVIDLSTNQRDINQQMIYINDIYIKASDLKYGLELAWKKAQLVTLEVVFNEEYPLPDNIIVIGNIHESPGNPHEGSTQSQEG